MKKILFLIYTIFLINTASATLIFQEDFETQTTGNYTLLSGTPTFASTPPHGYYLLNDPLDTVDLINTSIPDYHNFEFQYYVKIDSTNYYKHNIYFYDSLFNSYLYIEFDKTPIVTDFFYIDCYDGVSYCSGYTSNSINLSAYRDGNGYVKIKIKFDNNLTTLYINDVNITSYSLDIGIPTNFTITETFLEKDYPLAFDDVTLNTITAESTPSIIGHVGFIDVNGSTYNLANATVRYNSTLSTTTDTNGDFELIGIPYGILTVSMNDAFNIDSGNKTDFTLYYSRPSMTYPNLTGNFFYSTYSNSILQIKYWSNPYFVWGHYNYNSSNTTQTCVISTGNTFRCNVLSGNYIFNISYSDIYNYNLDIYHPFLTGNRIFYTGDYNAYNNTQILKNEIKPISSMVNKESYLRGVIFNLAFILFIIFGYIYYKGFGEKPKGRRVILWK